MGAPQKTETNGTKTIAAIIVAALTTLAFSGTAMAAGDYLSKVDAALNAWKTLDYRYVIKTENSSGDATIMKLRMRMRRSKEGHNQQMTEISEPADMKGTKVLIASPTKMYIYVPSLRKVRRIASHVTEQGFLGTALSQRDMSLTRYSTYYTAKTIKDAKGKATLKLTAKPDSHAPYPSIEMVIKTDKFLPQSLKYFNAEGKHIKSERRRRYKCKNGYCAPTRMTVEDHTSNVKTQLKLRKHKVDSKIADEVFSKRYLHK